ncbi:MAG: hypothetical protein U0792_10775 [Gemmataceae bacterium]
MFRMNIRTVGMLGVLLLVVVLMGDQLRQIHDDISILPPIDYMQYWSAGRATLAGQNPYSGDVLLPPSAADAAIVRFPGDDVEPAVDAAADDAPRPVPVAARPTPLACGEPRCRRRFRGATVAAVRR